MCNYTCPPKAKLTELERQYVLLTQSGLPIVAQPYHFIAERLHISVADVLAMTKDLKARGVIRRIAAVPNHYKLGYRYNGMTVWDVQDEHVQAFGQAVGRLPFVSHCYLRPRHLPRWNYNLFAMVHGKTAEQVQQYRIQIKDLLENVLQLRNDDIDQARSYQSNDILISTEILKKTGLRLKR
ncbi:transcriptional regulator, AsnC family [Colwellia chukchiensis]|uniref:siroheme decarboxylase n=1 Tax=Colwellia chukchiensis TaxID=641665 RepID=A0A1H7M242_9GAMM|nr:Lrp/AsnC family transcriptional regulator [Colwellia chukchiensis]SEL05058.1 transcriptional regulator, AsnC family [Colwellia chukchiensis]